MEETFSVAMFAADLFNYVFKDTYEREVILIDSCLRDLGGAIFEEVIGRAVVAIMDANWESIRGTFKQLCKRRPSLHEIAGWAMTRSSLHFSEGYRPDAFLFYCAMVCGLADLFYSNEKFDEALQLSYIMTSVLTAFFLTREFRDHGGWESLRESAVAILRNEQRYGKTRRRQNDKRE